MAAPRTTAPPPAPSAVPKGWLIALAAVSLTPWLVAAAIYSRGGVYTAPAPASSPAASATTGSSGPWGRLTASPIIVSPPLEYIPADTAAPNTISWRMPATTPQVATSFLAWTGMAQADVARLIASAKPDAAIGGLAVFPDAAFIRGMPAEVRARLYSQLGKTPFNPAQAEAYRFLGASAADWFDGSPIAPETRALVEPLLYRDGPFLHFADLATVRPEIKDDDEWRRLRKTLMRSSTLLVRLSVESAADVTALTQYWGAQGRRLDIRPLLESIAGGSPDRSIDIIHLLPSLARNHLYRYPKLTAVDLAKPLLANCLWSALNFFSLEPDDRYLDVATSLNTLRNDYYIVEDGFQLGDVVAFLDANDTVFHAAVYLADGLAFTKNGTSPMAPWTIMSIENIRAFYKLRSENARLIYHRRKDL